MTETIQEFHFHIYYQQETRRSAETLWQKISTLAVGRLKVYTLSDGPRGPHVTPMFGVDVPAADVPEVLGFVMRYHGPHPVLMHPVTGNELLDHTHHAFWLGTPQQLDLSKLV